MKEQLSTKLPHMDSEKEEAPFPMLPLKICLMGTYLNCSMSSSTFSLQPPQWVDAPVAS
jgi:hypothetical protein